MSLSNLNLLPIESIMSDASFFLILLLLGIIQVILFTILGWDHKIYAFFSGSKSSFTRKEPSNVQLKEKKTEDNDDKRVCLFKGDVEVVFKSLGLFSEKFFGGNSTCGVNTCAAGGDSSAAGVDYTCGANGNSTCGVNTFGASGNSTCENGNITYGVNTCGEICTTHFKCSMKMCGAYCSTCEVTTEKSPLFSSSDEFQDAKKTEEIWDSEDVSKLFDEDAAKAAVAKEEEVKAAFDVYDENKDGFIDEFELQRILCGLGFKEGLEVENCRKMIILADTNADGMLDFTEFVNFLEKSF